MSQVAGIQFEKDSRGGDRYVRIDLELYGNEIEPFLREIQRTRHDPFDVDWENSLNPDQFKNEMHQRIQKWNEK